MIETYERCQAHTKAYRYDSADGSERAVIVRCKRDAGHEGSHRCALYPERQSRDDWHWNDGENWVPDPERPGTWDFANEIRFRERERLYLEEQRRLREAPRVRVRCDSTYALNDGRVLRCDLEVGHGNVCVSGEGIDRWQWRDHRMQFQVTPDELRNYRLTYTADMGFQVVRG